MHGVHNSAHILFTLITSYFSKKIIAGLNYYTMTLNNQKIVNLTRMQHRSCSKGLKLGTCSSISKKSTVLVCRNKAMGHAVRPSFIVNGDVIPESEKVNYLGHIICSDLSDDEDMMRQRRHLLKGMSYLEFFICVRSLLKILYSVPSVRPCILVTCGGTIRHRALIS